MKLPMQCMRIISGSDQRAEVRDGSCIVMPVPGLENGETVSKTFSCPMALNARRYGAPTMLFSIDLENRTLCSFHRVEAAAERSAVELPDPDERCLADLMRYEEGYPQFLALAFRTGLTEEELAFCRELMAALERAFGQLMEYYRWLVPELFDWLREKESGSK